VALGRAVAGGSRTVPRGAGPERERREPLWTRPNKRVRRSSCVAGSCVPARSMESSETTAPDLGTALRCGQSPESKLMAKNHFGIRRVFPSLCKRRSRNVLRFASVPHEPDKISDQAISVFTVNSFKRRRIQPGVWAILLRAQISGIAGPPQYEANVLHGRQRKRKIRHARLSFGRAIFCRTALRPRRVCRFGMPSGVSERLSRFLDGEFRIVLRVMFVKTPILRDGRNHQFW
jgi:hypothetical protein